MADKSIHIRIRVDEYSYRAQYSADDRAFIGLVNEFPGLSAFLDTWEGAIKEIKTVVSEGPRLLSERNEQIPEPLSRHEWPG